MKKLVDYIVETLDVGRFEERIDALNDPDMVIGPLVNAVNLEWQQLEEVQSYFDEKYPDGNLTDILEEIESEKSEARDYLRDLAGSRERINQAHAQRRKGVAI